VNAGAKVDFKCLPTGDLRSTRITPRELDRALDLAEAEVKPLTGFETHLLACIRGEARPACPRERALLDAVLEVRDEQTDAEEDLEELEAEEDINFWSVDEFIARSQNSQGMGYEEAFSVPTHDRATAELDRRAYLEWKSDLHD
jgi:hypothetical protein